jgi:predicted esterase
MLPLSASSSVTQTIALGQDRSETADASDPLESQLALAGSNRSELETALAAASPRQRSDMEFLVKYMPVEDLRTLSSEFLIQHTSAIETAFNAAPWKDRVPESVYRNAILPYANVTEARELWCEKLRQKVLPLIEDVDTPGLAAARINQKLFSLVDVKYSTKRKRADQSPSESIESGLASCSGLSILLIDACRSVGIPARFAGTASWNDNSGNHSWVEIWDGDWHFTGAAEATGDSLDKGWFTGRAAKAKSGDPRYGIFAVQYEYSEDVFPLVWSVNRRSTYAEDVTSRYVTSQKTDSKKKIVRFRAFAPASQNRCVADLIVKDDSDQIVFRGQTRDESADANNHLDANLSTGTYQVELMRDGQTIRQTVVVDEPEQLITIRLDESPIAPLKAALDDTSLTLDAISKLPLATQPLTEDQANKARDLLWARYQKQDLKAREKELKDQSISMNGKTLRFLTKTFGDAPDNGHALVISMHGGGGAPAAVNDQQWKNQIRLYELEECIYVAPRAPTDTWNLWHQAHIDSLFDRLIEDMVIVEGVDPNRVYLTGYSAGGDGVYQLAPRMSDRFAGAAMMAGHPNETQPDGLRNIPFALYMGGKDAAYKRNQIAETWKGKLAALQDSDPDGYEHSVVIFPEYGHWMQGKDLAGVQWMMQFSRRLSPQRLVWVQDDVLDERHYWLTVNATEAKPRDRLVVQRTDQGYLVEEATPARFSILLAADVDVSEPIVVRNSSGKEQQIQAERTIATLIETLQQRGDVTTMRPGKISVDTENWTDPK